MSEEGFKPIRVQRQLTGKAMTIGNRIVQPVASVSGWVGGAGNQEGSGVGGVLSMTPVEVIVREADGREQRVPTTDATGASVRGILFASLVGPLIWLVARLAARRSSRWQ